MLCDFSDQEFQSGVKFFEAVSVVAEIPIYDELGREEVHFIFLSAPTSAQGEVGCFHEFTFFVFDSFAWHSSLLPSLGHDQIDVIMHYVMPVVHELLIDRILI